MIIVTGATGMVGGNLIWQLLQDNDRIKAIRRESSSLEPLKSILGFYTSQVTQFLDRIDWVLADIQNENSLNAAFSNVSIVYHCAAIVSLGNSIHNITDVNVVGTRNVVNACLSSNVSKLCFVSSIAACGTTGITELVTEENEWVDKPNQSIYAKSKYYSEQEVWVGIGKGLNAVIVNPGVILGVSGTSTGSSELFYRVKNGLPFYTLGGSGYIDVRDVVKAMIQLTNSEISGERFILVAENCSNKDVLSWMAVGFGKKKPYICLGKNLLLVLGYFIEIFAVIFRIKPTINRNTLRTASTRTYYSNSKIKSYLNLDYVPVERCIREVCNYIKR